jgi:homogentisate phytyltransferase/homogentisate geranylgeranyltransferase
MGSFPQVRDVAQPAVPGRERILRLPAGLGVLWRFSRPHTILGTASAIAGVYLVAIAELAAGEPAADVADLLWVLLAGVCVNVFIVGINQLEDVDIDRINKPDLPIAAGDLAPEAARWIVALCAVVPIVLALTQGAVELVSVTAALAIGAAYSCPPLRLKRYPAVAALSITLVRTVIVNLGVWLHFAATFRGDTSLAGVSPAVWVLAALTLPFSFAIAILKDVPDIEGDRRFDIATFSVRLGARPVFLLGAGAVVAAQLGTALAGPLALPEASAPLLVAGHLAAAGALMWCAARVRLTDQSGFTTFYQRVWRLFFLEYAIVPLALLVG